MRLNDVATVRTGLVSSRKKTSSSALNAYEYKMLNLKCMMEKGYLDLNNVETYWSSERLKPEYFTRLGDILVRLSAPYTAVMITEDIYCEYLIPSHFSIIRVDKSKAVPEYIYWALKRDKTRKMIAQNNSGSTSFGTISSGFFSNLSIKGLPIDKQNIVGKLFLLSDKEQELLQELAEKKALYNKLLVDEIYDNIKRGNNE